MLRQVRHPLVFDLAGGIWTDMMSLDTELKAKIEAFKAERKGAKNRETAQAAESMDTSSG